MSTLRAVFAIILLALVSAVLIPAQYLALAVGWQTAIRTLPYWWHRAATKIIGIRVHRHGAPAATRPLLIASNHVSWLDITVLGSLMPLSFISKSEVAGWPVFGLFAKLQRSVFVERERRTKTGAVAGEIAARLSGGDVLVLFAEGTSSNGIHVLPFRTALIGAAARAIEAGGEASGGGGHASAGAASAPGPAGPVTGEAGHTGVTIQPLAINYTQLHGLPIGRFHKPRIAWYGDMEMAGHLWWVLKHGEIDVDVAFGEPLAFVPGADRKLLARSAEQSVRRLVGEATAGRLERPRKAA